MTKNRRTRCDASASSSAPCGTTSARSFALAPARHGSGSGAGVAPARPLRARLVPIGVRLGQAGLPQRLVQLAPAASLQEHGADGGALIVFDTATFKEVNRMPMQSRASTTCTTRSRGPKGRATEPGPAGGLPSSCELAQSLKLGTFLAMLAVMASVRSWLMSMAAFQVAM